MEYDIRQGNNIIKNDEEEKADEAIQRLNLERKIASEKNKIATKNLVEDYIKYKTDKILKDIDMSDSHIVVEKWKIFQELSQNFGDKNVRENFEQKLFDYISQMSFSIEYEEQIISLRKYLDTIEKNTSIRFADKQKYIADAEQSAKTVLGTVYNSYEEARAERKKVVGNKKFDSEEEADNERIRIKAEEELAKREMNLIGEWEQKNTPAATILKQILEKKFVSMPAKEKLKNYSEQILRQYSLLKNKNIQAEIMKLHTKRILGLIFGVIALIIGIKPFFLVGTVGKVIIFFIVGLPWGIMLQAKESLDDLHKEKEYLKYLEDVFLFQNGQVMLKNTIRRDNGNEKMDTNNLVKVCVIEKYKDKEKGELLEPGVVFETSIERANQLINAKVAKRVD